MSWQEQIPHCFLGVKTEALERDDKLARLQALVRETRTAGSEKSALISEIQRHLAEAVKDPVHREQLLDEVENELDELWEQADA